MTALGSGVRVGVGIGVSACCVAGVAVPGTPVSDGVGVGAGSTVAGEGGQPVRRSIKAIDKNRIAYLRFRGVLLRIMILAPLPKNSRLHYSTDFMAIQAAFSRGCHTPSGKGGRRRGIRSIICL